MHDTLSIAFTGDIGFDKYMDKKWEDPELLSEEILAFLHSSDHVVANVEGPLIESEQFDAKTGAAQLLHSMNPAAVEVLKRMQADVWNICNNHIMDAGEAGIFATLKEAAAAGAMTVGAGRNLEEAAKPLFFKEAGGVGIFSVGYDRACRIAAADKAGCLNFSAMDVVEENIKKIKANNRWCIVVAHDGEEFTALPTSYTRDRYLKYLELGADIVVAHHPHVPMNYELVGDKAIFYSLGNFIFDTPYQRAQFNTEKGILLKLILDDKRFSFDAMGLLIDREKERVVKAPLPDIFENVPEDEYKLLEPLAAKMFIANTKRQIIYFKPEEYEHASEEKWLENFMQPLRSGRVPGQLLDLPIVLETAKRAEEGEWEKSKLKSVKKFILEQLEIE